MQPNSNRPVYIVQPSNITHLNVRPTIITTGGQQLQPQAQPVYQLSTVRQPAVPQTTSTLYQVQSKPRLVSSSPVYGSLQSQRFATSPQQLRTTNANISPRLITPPSAPRMPIYPPQPTTTLLRPFVPTVSTPPTPSSSSSAAAATTTTTQPAAPGGKEYFVKVPKTRARYGIMEFASGLSIDAKDWKAVEMRREINPYTYRPATNLEPSDPASASITTSLGMVLPKTGAGSEYGREQKEALKRKRYATKGTNLEDLPWILTDRSSTEKKLKHYRGLKKGGVTTNSSYYVFIQGKDGFEAYPVEDWYGFTPTNVYKTLDFDEAEKQYQERHKNLSKWFLKHKVNNEKETENDPENNQEKGKKSTGKGRRDFKLLDADDWIKEEDADEEEDNERDEDGDKEKSNKKSKTNKNDEKKPKDGWTLSDDDDEDEGDQKKVKKAKTTKIETNEEQGEDSDDGDHEGDEVEYTSDESSDDEDDRDANTAEATSKYEVKGVDEQMKAIPDIEKRLEQMDEHGEDFDFDDEDDEIPDIDENEEENGKTVGDDLSDVGKLFQSDAVSKEMESSSDDDDLDDSDDPDKESIEPITTSINNQPIPSEQVKTEKGHKKAKEEEMRAIKSKVMSLPTTPANPSETITEEKVRSLLLRKQQMTSTELIQHFLSKTDNLRTKEVKEGIVQKLGNILKRLNIEEKLINGKKYIKLKST